MLPTFSHNFYFSWFISWVYLFLRSFLVVERDEDEWDLEPLESDVVNDPGPSAPAKALKMTNAMRSLAGKNAKLLSPVKTGREVKAFKKPSKPFQFLTNFLINSD